MRTTINIPDEFAERLNDRLGYMGYASLNEFIMTLCRNYLLKFEKENAIVKPDSTNPPAKILPPVPTLKKTPALVTGTQLASLTNSFNPAPKPVKKKKDK